MFSNHSIVSPEQKLMKRTTFFSNEGKISLIRSAQNMRDVASTAGNSNFCKTSAPRSKIATFQFWIFPQ
jgi:hypothetical protein